ncbi:medium-chain fatty acid-CoA ligase faa2 [Tieghemiomyces parasiticus]|uniref:Medium-chain fatty acid-CoA ligase faa2 n=1 Tax=Tieghemiomyces parasiticus TaxID=78921 RepID=A0A9W7ZNH6_9FUNG|nr:medium-chain fatty acid-CoA ligase faa2 [Tieghemiomyces parasiticus]
MTKPRPEFTSTYDNFKRANAAFGNNPFIGQREIVNGKAGPYVWQTYHEVFERTENFGSGLAYLGLHPQDNLGIFANNCPEWVIAEQAGYMYNYVSVPIHDTLGEEAMRHIISQTELQFLCTTENKALAILKDDSLGPYCQQLIIIDSIGQDLIQLAEHRKVHLMYFADIERLGAEHHTPPSPGGLSDLATICYTSGTTGVPKGAMLTHRNILTSVAVAENMIHEGQFFGARIGFSQGDILKVMDDIAELKPTIFIGVPRILNRIYDKVWAAVNTRGGLRGFLFRLAVASKLRGLEYGRTSHWMWDRMVFKKIRTLLGGECKLIVSGSAPLSPDVMDFLRIAFNTIVLQGYGQTETVAVLTITDPKDRTAGTVGPPQPCNEVKLVDVPALNYTTRDRPFPRGEICVRGPNVFHGYYRAPEQTAEVLSPDGWLRTGDVGMWDDQGRLIVIDRVKNIFKLAQGEYVAPERVENLYLTHPLVNQLFLHGDPLETYTIAVLVPEPDVLRELVAEHQLDAGTRYSTYEAASKHRSQIPVHLYIDPEVRQMVVRELTTHAKMNGAKGFECFRNVYLEAEPFSAENGLMSSSHKLKRPAARAHYAAQINAMYGELTKH